MTSRDFRAAMEIEIVEANIEWLHPLQRGKTDTTGSNDGDLHAFHVIGTCRGVSNISSAAADNFVLMEIVAHEAENHHHRVLGHTNRIEEGHVGDGDLMLVRRNEIDMV